MTPDIASTIEVEFEDGRFVVPRWWANLPFLRSGEYSGNIKRVPFTLAEARDKVNVDLLNTTIKQGMRRSISAGKGGR